MEDESGMFSEGDDHLLDESEAPPRKRRRTISKKMALDDDEAALGQALKCQIMNEGPSDVQETDESSTSDVAEEEDEGGALESHGVMDESLDCGGEDNGFVFDTNGVCFSFFEISFEKCNKIFR